MYSHIDKLVKFLFLYYSHFKYRCAKI